jgi:hypothetical protein
MVEDDVIQERMNSLTRSRKRKTITRPQAVIFSPVNELSDNKKVLPHWLNAFE